LLSHDPPMTLLQPRTVRRALDAMHANIGHRWTIGELASLVGTSGRTLQRQFLSFLGKTPLAVLKDTRFERARRELLQGVPGAKVMDVAARCGFPHFGRFAVEYRRRYGETRSAWTRTTSTTHGALAAMPPLFILRTGSFIAASACARGIIPCSAMSASTVLRRSRLRSG